MISMLIKQIISFLIKVSLLNIFSGINFIEIAKANSNEELQNSSFEYIRDIPRNSFYIIDTGDTLLIKVNDNAEELDQIITVDGQGTVILKRLNKVYISGLTISELTEILNEEYKNFVLEPEVNITILKYRPVKFFIDGEIQQPGLHVMPGSLNPLNPMQPSTGLNQGVPDNQEISYNSPTYFPTLIDVLRKSQGITVNSDLANISIIRKNKISSGGGLISTNVNLLDLIEMRDFKQNLRIFDGDSIFIPRNDKPVFEQISKALKTNINPENIKVVVSGRVEEPGLKLISRSSVLTDVIEYSGGAKIIKGPVKFIRYTADGSLDKRVFRFNSRAKRGSYKNPYLNNGDFIYVGKGLVNASTEVMTEVSQPFQGFLGLYGLIKAFDSIF